jgi:catechol 2,3-dioxygenase-like lactoylglutathione lyase family enzyme
MPTATPISRRIGQVFIPVTDIARSAAWYCRLLGLEIGDASHQDTIYDLPMDGETRLALDANQTDVDPSGPPRFFFWTDDIAATVEFLTDINAPVDSVITDIGSVFFVQFRDPDGNPLMVCQRARQN